MSKPPSVNGWLSGKAKFLRGENLLKAAAKLGVSAKWLAEGLGPMAADSTDTAQAPPPQAIDWRALAYAEAKLVPESDAREFLLTFLGLVDERVQARQRLHDLAPRQLFTAAPAHGNARHE